MCADAETFLCCATVVPSFFCLFNSDIVDNFSFYRTVERQRERGKNGIIWCVCPNNKQEWDESDPGRCVWTQRNIEREIEDGAAKMCC